MIDWKDINIGRPLEDGEYLICIDIDGEKEVIQFSYELDMEYFYRLREFYSRDNSWNQGMCYITHWAYLDLPKE